MNYFIKFHDPDVDDPDWCVTCCYNLLTEGTSEMEWGIENIWKRGQSNRRRSHPDFGKYVPITPFKSLLISATYA